MKALRTSGRLAVLACACGALAACGGQLQRNPSMSWNMYQNGPTHNAVVRMAFPVTNWTLDLRSKINGGLAFDGSTLYAVDFARDLVAIDPRSGRILWRARTDDVVMSTPIVAENSVFVGSGTNAILWDRPGSAVWGRKRGNHWYAFRADNGRLRWSHPVTGEAMPSAAYVAGRVIFATGDNRVTAVAAASGKTLWSAPLPGVPTMASAMVRGGTVFLVATQGKPEYASPTRSHTLAFRVGSGRLRWSAPYGNADCTPTIAGGRVFVEGAKDGPLGPLEAVGYNEVDALDARTGALQWRYRTPSGVFTDVGSNERAITATYAGGVLYQPLPAIDAIAAFRARDGRVLWLRHTGGPVKMSPLVYRGAVFFGDTSGVFYRLDAKDGRVRAAFPYKKPFTTSPPLIVGKTLFVADSDTLRAVALDRL